MKKTLQILGIITILFLLLISDSYSKSNKEKMLAEPIPSADYILNNGHMGNLFWVAIPQNEVSTGGLKQIGLEILVSSAKNTTVTMSIPDLGVVKTKQVEAFKTTSFSSKASEVNWTLEVSETEQAVSKGIRLESTEPICVYVMNVKEYSADGYMAAPVCQWDKEYIHCAYYDFAETSGFQRGKRGGGFIIIASENGTNVTINCDGIGAGVAKTMGGHEIGDSWTVTLDSGACYMVRGDGETRGLFDISGTRIRATKPVGMISFHQRTMIPSTCPEDRDHLNEWLPPTSTWGTEYVTVQFDRKISGQKRGQGDLFRVVALQDNTKISCSYYDVSSGDLEGNQDVPLAKAGDWADILDIRDINDRNTKKSVYGVSRWQSDKPFMLIQNAFSSEWDGDSRWSPLSVSIPPLQQYVKNAVFQAPVNTDFNTNQLTIFAVGDPNDPEAKALKSVALDGVEIYKNDSKILANRISGTNVYWTRILVSEGAHFITSNTLISGYLTGFSNSNAYGYTLVSNYNKIDSKDDKAPRLTRTMSCGNYSYEAIETGTESGISKILLMEHLSDNYVLSLENPAAFKPQMKIVKQKFNLNVKDDTKSANAIIAVMDRNGNLVYDTVKFEPRKLAFTSSEISFGKNRVGLAVNKNLTVTNNNTDSVLFTKVYLKGGSNFTLTNPMQNFKIAPSASFDVNISYTPIRKSVDATDSDTLFVETLCSKFKFYINGRGVIPVVGVQDWDFKDLLVGTRKCIEDFSVEGLRIDNTGSDVLKIISIEGVTNPFLLEQPTTPVMPFTIDPGKSVYLKSICFIPSDTLLKKITLTIKSDAFEGDSIFTLSGKGIAKEDPKSVDDNFDNAFGIKVVPNPSYEKDINLIYSLDESLDITIDIIDSKGNNVYKLKPAENRSGLNQIRLNTDAFPQGVYFIKMSSAGRTANCRLLLVK